MNGTLFYRGVTRTTETNDIIQLMGVPWVLKGPNRLYMMNIGVLSEFGFVFSTVLTLVLISHQRSTSYMGPSMSVERLTCFPPMVAVSNDIR